VINESNIRCDFFTDSIGLPKGSISFKIQSNHVYFQDDTWLTLTCNMMRLCDTILLLIVCSIQYTLSNQLVFTSEHSQSHSFEMFIKKK